LIHPGVQFKSVKGDTLFADGDFREMGPDLVIEAITVHAHIEGGIPESDEPG
jgi:hypothetical protein